MGGGGGGGQQVGELSRQQREIVAATFNIVRDKAKTKPEKYRENVVFLNLAQAKLREQVEELVQKLVSRLGAVDPSYNKIAEVLPKAAEEMKAAETELKSMKADSALSPEQRALKLLQEAEQQYELQVAQQQGGGGGGGGQNSALAEDLADLFELELDKLANQYEMQQRAEQQQGDQQIDQLVEKLKELARRQQQEIEQEQKEVASEVNGLDQSQSGSGGKAQALAQRKEAMDAKVADLQNQLEKLANQMRRDEKDAARKLDEAAGSIRDKRIREKIRYTQRVLQQGAGSQQARGMEEDIGANLDA